MSTHPLPPSTEASFYLLHYNLRESLLVTAESFRKMSEALKNATTPAEVTAALDADITKPGEAS